ncbi:hypothetical protein MKZ38_004847 [Zalerion maritima]|uniref:Uncharacterized protein n=1 Tax=Zalerion maritima TaxID=339359 RepID=A0AAD5RRP9_9PEZI|nr:hypothetical protein MKZ38_004847 [Zalerion maritima]
MSSAKRSRSRAACVEDVDEDTGSIIENTAKFATSQPSSPTRKPQPNSSKSRKQPDPYRRGRSPNRGRYDPGEDGHIVRMRQGPGVAKEKPRRPSLRPIPRGQKPHIIQSTPGPRPDESEFYGVPPTPAHPDGRPQLRQRAQTAAMGRPPSFHAGEFSRPPHPFGRYPAGPPPGPPGPPGHAGLPTSFPPRTWYQTGGPPGHGGPPQHQPPPHTPRTPLDGPPHGYFPPNQQYGPPPGHPGPHGLPGPGPMPGRARPRSSIGHHRPQPSFDFDAAFEHDDAEGGPPGPPPPGPAPVGRRPSVGQRRTRDVQDRRSMPPPPPPPNNRPQSARPANSIMYRLPPQTPSTRSISNRKVNFSRSEDEEDSDDIEYLGQEASLEWGIPEQRYLPAPPAPSMVPRSQGGGRRPSISDRTNTYANAGYRAEVARSRRHSTLGTSFGRGGLEEDSEEGDDLNDKIKKLQLYTGGPPAPPPPRQRLTQGALRRVSQRGEGSSRSTGSSDSFDESEVPTHTTRTSHSNGDENGGGGVKIRGAKRINIGGVDVELGGAEIEIQANQKEHKGSFRDDASTMYRGDTRSHYNGPRPPMPQRTNSKADSFSRSRTAHPQLASGFPPPPSNYGYPSPGGMYHSPAAAYPELEWQPSPQSYDYAGGGGWYHH